jgi:hypothetical protein
MLQWQALRPNNKTIVKINEYKHTASSKFISPHCAILLALCKHLRVFLIYLCHYNNFLYLDIATKEKKAK